MQSTARANGRSQKPSKSQGNGRGMKWTEKVATAIGGLFHGIELEFDSLRDLYVKELQDLYSAEHQLLKALPKLAKAASSAALRDAFQAHLKETEGQVKRLEQVFRGLGLTPKQSKCKAMAGLIAEGDEWMGEHAKPGVMDAGLIAAAQRVEHYEMAGYGCVRTYAKLLGDSKGAALLQATLDEEGSADKKLTQLSKRINVQAEAGGKQKSMAGGPKSDRRSNHKVTSSRHRQAAK